jgi:hypothetical protein
MLESALVTKKIMFYVNFYNLFPLALYNKHTYTQPISFIFWDFEYYV